MKIQKKIGSGQTNSRQARTEGDMNYVGRGHQAEVWWKWVQVQIHGWRGHQIWMRTETLSPLGRTLMSVIHPLPYSLQVTKLFETRGFSSSGLFTTV